MVSEIIWIHLVSHVLELSSEMIGLHPQPECVGPFFESLEAFRFSPRF